MIMIHWKIHTLLLLGVCCIRQNIHPLVPMFVLFVVCCLLLLLIRLIKSNCVDSYGANGSVESCLKERLSAGPQCVSTERVK